jgi:hypothetical protein
VSSLYRLRLWLLEKLPLFGAPFSLMKSQPQMLTGLLGNFSAALGPANETYLQKIRFDHVLQRITLFA